MNHVNDTLNARRNDELRRQQHDLDARRSAQNLGAVAGASTLALPGGIREPPAGDRDQVFKAALADAPACPLFKRGEAPVERKSDHEVAMTRTEQNERAVSLIKLAHSRGENWQPFAESQTSSIAKLHAQVGLDEVGEIDIERGEIRISKAA